MRAKFIYETFTANSDPIKDMNIGIDHKRTFKNIEELTEWVLKNLPHILGRKNIPNDIIKDTEKWINWYHEKKN